MWGLTIELGEKRNGLTLVPKKETCFWKSACLPLSPPGEERGGTSLWRDPLGAQHTRAQLAFPWVVWLSAYSRVILSWPLVPRPQGHSTLLATRAEQRPRIQGRLQGPQLLRTLPFSLSAGSSLPLLAEEGTEGMS